VLHCRGNHRGVLKAVDDKGGGRWLPTSAVKIEIEGARKAGPGCRLAGDAVRLRRRAADQVIAART
jgi:hypothetical protein